MPIKPKKSLGQNFLIDKNIIQYIANIAEINTKDTLLEIGPGTGNLTKELIQKKPKKIIVVEKDKVLSEKLKNNFGEKIQVLNEDILKIDEENLSKDKMIFFGNLPYNISSQILVKWIKLKNLNSICKKFVLMFQKEVADRIIAEFNKKNYSRISILSSWRLEIKQVKEISSNSFYPKPKVKSSLLLIEPKKKFYNFKNPKNLEHITRVFFNQKRKMINKPMSQLFKDINYVSKKLNINLNDRPQNLDPLTYFKLCKEYEKKLN